MSDSLTGALEPGHAIPQVWGRVPLRNKNFTGREQILEHLHDSLSSRATAVVPTALHGLGGVGKTQVAIEYAYRYQGIYDLVWWISADQPVLVRSSLAALAPHLGLPSATAAGIEDVAAAVLDALRRGEPYSRWLLIFDNADSPEDIKEILPGGPGHVLITSRNHRWEGVVETLPVDVFAREESVEFLTKRVRKGGDEAHANLLADELGDLPLALEQAAALQAETGMSITEYLRLFHDQTAKLLAEGKPTDYPVSMTVAWSLSVSQLKDKLPEAVELLRCCAFFGPEPIPRDVFVPLAAAMQRQAKTEITENGTAEQPAAPAQAGIELLTEVVLDPQLAALLDDPILLSTAIRELGRYALAKIDPISRTIQVHRLVQALLRDELSTDDRIRIRHVAHMLLANAAPKFPDNRANWPRFEELLAHADPSFVVQCPDPAVRTFCLDLVRYLYTSGNPNAAKAFVERTIQHWERTGGPENRYVLEARRHLGIVLRDIGDYRAAYTINKATLEAMRAVLGPEHEQTLLLTNSHGADLRARGLFEEALRHDQDSRHRHEAVFGPLDRRTLRSSNNLAVDYGLISDYKTARKLHMATFQRQRIPESGVSVQDTLACWNGLARVVRLSGDYAEAVDLGEDAFAFGVHELGSTHPWTLRTAKDLSIAKRMSGAVTDGLEIAEDTYDKELRNFGPNHPDTLAAALNVANARRTIGRVEEGFVLADDVMFRYADVFGADHPYVNGCRVNLALLYRVRGDREQACEMDELVFSRLSTMVGDNHHFTLTSAVNLASDHAALGRPARAKELGEATLSLARATLGKDHPLTIGCAANLTFDLRASGAGEQADQLRDEVKDQYNDVLGLDHPDARAFLDDRRLDFDIDPPPI